MRSARTTTSPISNLLIPNAASMYGLEDVRGYASLTYAPYKKTTTLWCPNAQRSYHDVTDLEPAHPQRGVDVRARGRPWLRVADLRAVQENDHAVVPECAALVPRRHRSRTCSSPTRRRCTGSRTSVATRR